MKITYLGCEGAPQTSTHYGVAFTIGVPVEVADELAIAKLSRHPHFRVGGEQPAPVAAAAVEVETSVDDEREAVVAQARELGIRIGRKGIDTLKAEIAEALGAD